MNRVLKLVLVLGFVISFAESFPELHISAKNINRDFKSATFIMKNFVLEQTTYDSLYFDGEIRLRGNSTASAPKKPYNIKFESKLNLFGFGKAKKWILLSNPFDPTLMRNKLIYDLAQQLNFIYSCKSTFVDVWLNGEFVGNYLLTTKIEFKKTRIDYDTENNDFLLEYDLKRDKKETIYFYTPDSSRFALTEPETLEKSKRNYLENYFDNLETLLNTYDIYQYAPYFDIPSSLDYYWIEEFTSDPDMHTGSRFFTIHNDVFQSGPVWDYDLALGNTPSKAKSKTSGIYALGYFYYPYLIKDSVYCYLLYSRFLELVPYFENLAKDNELGKNQIDLILEKYGESFKRNFSDSGWTMEQVQDKYNADPLPTFEENVDSLRKWILGRLKYLKNYSEKKLDSLKNYKTTWKEISDSMNSSSSEKQMEKKSNSSSSEKSPNDKSNISSCSSSKNSTHKDKDSLKSSSSKKSSNDKSDSLHKDVERDRIVEIKKRNSIFVEIRDNHLIVNGISELTKYYVMDINGKIILDGTAYKGVSIKINNAGTYILMLKSNNSNICPNYYRFVVR